jgi:hypothetical protein
LSLDNTKRILRQMNLRTLASLKEK